MSRYSKKKKNTIALVAVVAAAALALVALFSGLGRTPNEDNLFSLEFETYENGNGYDIIANENGSLTFDGELKGDEPETVLYETIKLKAGTYTISTGTNGNPYTYCMTVKSGDEIVAYSDSGNMATFVLDAENTVSVYILVNPGAEIDGLTIYPVLCKGDEPVSFFGNVSSK